MNNYYCRMQPKGSKHLEQMLKDQVVLEKFFDLEDDFTSYLAQSANFQNHFQSYLQKTKQIEKLIDYCIFPDKVVKNSTFQYFDLCKYAYLSIMIFDILKQRIVETDPPKYLGYIFSYLDQEELQPTSSAYFEQILIYIFSLENVITWMMDKNNQHQLAKFVKHVGVEQIANQLVQTLKYESEFEQKFTLIKMLVKQFKDDEEEDSETLQNIAFIFNEIFRTIDDMDADYLQPLAEYIYQSKYMKIYLEKLFKTNDSCNITYIASILISIIKNQKAISFIGQKEFLPYLNNLIDLIAYNDKSKTYQLTINTSYDMKIKHFGQGRMKVLELFYYFFMYYQNDLKLINGISKTNFFEIIFKLFLKYTWNTKLTFLIENIFCEAIKSNINDLSNSLIQNLQIAGEIARHYRKSEIFTQYGTQKRQFKNGHVGSLTKIARTLEETKYNKVIQEYLNNSDKWKAFKQNKLEGLTQREELEWKSDLDDLGSLPKLENSWISYLDNSMPGQARMMQFSSNMIMSMSRSPTHKKNMQKKEFLMEDSLQMRMEESTSGQTKIKLNNMSEMGIGQLKPVRVKSTQVVLNNPNNPKELFIFVALNGCGADKCTGIFCQSNPHFREKYSNLSESDVMKLCTPKNIANFKPCEQIAKQFLNKEGKSKLQYDQLHQTFGSYVNFRQVNQKQQCFWLKCSNQSSYDPKISKDATACVTKKSNQTNWILELQEKDIYQIRSKQNGYLLTCSSNSNYSETQNMVVGIGHVDYIAQDKKQPVHPYQPDQQLESKWILIQQDSTSYYIQSALNKQYLQVSQTFKAKNKSDYQVSISPEKGQQSLWYIEYL